MLDGLGDLCMKSLVVILYYCGLRIAEVTGDKGRRWKILSKQGRTLSRAGALPDDWMGGAEGGLWIWKTRDELPGLRKEDLRVQGGLLYINAQVLKHGRREVPLELPVTLPYIELVMGQWYAAKPGERVWPVTTRKAWEIIDRASGHWIYPHAFRLSRATLMARTPGISVSDMKAWFGWARSNTADAYIVSQRSMRKARDSIEQSVRGEV
jgi:hypothetical protein